MSTTPLSGSAGKPNVTADPQAFEAPTVEEFSRLVHLVYEGALDERAWQTLLRLIAERLSGLFVYSHFFAIATAKERRRANESWLHTISPQSFKTEVSASRRRR